VKDRIIIFVAAFIRAVAVGMTGVLLALYLAELHFSTTMIGVVVGAGLAAGAVAALIATIAADSFGRRRFLLGLAIFSAAGGLVVSLAKSPAVVLVAAFFGMVNGMGRDRGASLVVEHAILPSTTTDERRTAAFAFYNVLQAGGGALGALIAGLLPESLQHFGALPQHVAMRVTMIVYAGLMGLTVILYPALSAAAEVPETRIGIGHVSRESRIVVLKLSGLFLFDSVGGGFLTNALISYFFVLRFGVSAAVVGTLFFATGIANALSQFAAAWLGRRIGLINTMVFTHIPSSLFLVGVAFAPNFPIAAALLLLRESLVQMDVPTRQSYVMAVVRPEERTFASGVTGLVRLGGWAIAPGFAGLLMQGLSMAAPLIIGPALKIAYDLMLYYEFRHLKPPEERTGGEVERQAVFTHAKGTRP
jgi:MFS family permease